MYRRFGHTSLLVSFIFTMILTSCGTRAPHYDFQALARAAVRLDMDIDEKDNHALYIEAARWMGVPYRYGGKTTRGVDCSGLTTQIYKKVYHKKLKANADDQRAKNCRKVTKGKLEEGDLVFFHDGRSKRKATHVGVYLKNGKFIHASSSQGVIISQVNDPYYKKRWMQGGRVK